MFRFKYGGPNSGIKRRPKDVATSLLVAQGSGASPTALALASHAQRIQNRNRGQAPPPPLSARRLPPNALRIQQHREQMKKFKDTLQKRPKTLQGDSSGDEDKDEDEEDPFSVSLNYIPPKKKQQ